jgi:hypothetical protein
MRFLAILADFSWKALLKYLDCLLKVRFLRF